MPRREIKARPVQPYRYMTTETERAVDICETAAETNGLHRIEPDVWPPVKRRGVVTDEAVMHRCVYCGSNVIVYPDNNPDESGVEIVAHKKELAGSKK